SSTIVFLSSQLPAFLHSLPPRRSSDLSPFGRPRLLGPVRFRGGVSGTAAAAGGSVEGFGRPPVCRGGDGSFGDRFADRNDSPPDAGDRFDSDRLSPGDHFGPRQRRPGAGVYGASDAFGQGAGNHRNHRRPRDQSGGDRRPSAAGAHGGLRPLFRRGPAPRLPDPPGGKKPVRLHQRDGRVRNEVRGAFRGGQPVGNVPFGAADGGGRIGRRRQSGGKSPGSGGGAGP